MLQVMGQTTPTKAGEIHVEQHVTVFLVNYITIFYIKLCVRNKSYIKYTYMIDREYSHIILVNPASLFTKGQVDKSRVFNFHSLHKYLSSPLWRIAFLHVPPSRQLCLFFNTLMRIYDFSFFSFSN